MLHCQCTLQPKISESEKYEQTRVVGFCSISINDKTKVDNIIFYLTVNVGINSAGHFTSIGNHSGTPQA
jgi:hypothetical protein